jgi:hypothetical protein
MKLIPDWRLAWKFLSVQAAVLLALLSGIQGEVLPLFAPLFPDHVWPWVSGGLALTIVVLRLVAQDLVQERELLGLQRLEAELDTLPLSEQWGSVEPDTSTHNPMPAGRFERCIGAVLMVVIVLSIFGFLAVAWLALQGPTA